MNHEAATPHSPNDSVRTAVALDDAYQALYKKAYVVTADSDHGATARLIKQRFPDLKFVSVVPPGMEASKSIMTHTQYRQKLTPEYLEDCLLPPHRIDEIDGRPTLKFRRPAEYATPAGWVAPSDRRRR